MRRLFHMATRKIKKSLSAVSARFRQKMEKAGIPVTKIIVFGSQARGTAKKWSDIDLCVVSPVFGKNRFEERLRLFALSSQVDINIEPHPFSPHDLLNKWDPLAGEINKYGIILFSQR